MSVTFTKKVHESRFERRGVMGRPPVKCINGVEGYWRERERESGRGMECSERESAGGGRGEARGISTINNSRQ